MPDRCRFTHEIPAYLAAKTRDIHIPDMAQISDTPPYAPAQDSLVTPHPDFPSLDLSTVCPVFSETGECRYGFKCRFLGGHIRIAETGEMSLVGDEDKKARAALTAHEVNFVGADVQKALRSRKVGQARTFNVICCITTIISTRSPLQMNTYANSPPKIPRNPKPYRRRIPLLSASRNRKWTLRCQPLLHNLLYRSLHRQSLPWTKSSRSARAIRRRQLRRWTHLTFVLGFQRKRDSTGKAKHVRCSLNLNRT